MKSSFVDEYVEDDIITDQDFVVSSKGSVTKYKSKPGFWFQLSLSDKTGSIPAKFWGTQEGEEIDIKKLFDSFSVGDIVRLSGEVGSFRDTLEVKIDIEANPPLKKIEDGEYDLEDFMKKSSRDIPQMIAELRQIVSEINNEHIKKLLESFTNDDDFMKKQYSQAPAAKKMHHDFVGGLLEHVLSLIAMSKTVKKSHPELNLDLLITACILHDIGKVVEYKITTTIEITTEGRLFGHLSIGYFMVAQKISEMSGFPEDLKLRILHMILSHHRELAQGAPVVPMFPEAVAFALIDDADAQSQHIIQFVKDPAPPNFSKQKDWMYENFLKKWNWTKPMDDNQ